MHRMVQGDAAEGAGHVLEHAPGDPVPGPFGRVMQSVLVPGTDAVAVAALQELSNTHKPTRIQKEID